MKNKISVKVSAILGAIFLAGLIVSCFFVPALINKVISMSDYENVISSLEKALMITDVYVIIAVGAFAVILMFLLLARVKNKVIFSRLTSKLLLYISLCCFAEGVLGGLLAFRFLVLICASIAAFFLGLCFLVVKNVLEEATAIKEENDFTV